MDEVNTLKMALLLSMVANVLLSWLAKRVKRRMHDMYNDLTGSYERCREASDQLIASQTDYIEALNARVWELTPADEREKRLKDIEADYLQRGGDITETSLWKIHHGLKPSSPNGTLGRE